MTTRKLPDSLRFLQAHSDRFPASANITALETPDGLTLIDTGGSGEDNHRRTREALEALGHAPADISSVLLTHAHADHSGGLSLLRAVRPDLRVAIHPRAMSMLDSLEAYFSTFDFDLIRRLYHDPESTARGMVDGLHYFLAFGPCPYEPFEPTAALSADPLHIGPLTFLPLLMEGHAPGHVMFYEPEARLLISGDLIGHQLAWHAPSSGGLTAYLDGLEQAARLPIDIILPAHGAPIEDCAAHIRGLADKLHRREDKLLEWLRDGPRSFSELRRLMSGQEEDGQLFPSVPMLEGHLQRLERLGRIQRSGGPDARSLYLERVHTD